MISIIDYGVGNLFSIKCSLKYLGFDAVVTDNVEDIKKSEKIILPGVGAFHDAYHKLKKSGLDKVICQEVKNNKDILGICLGMQLLFDRSFEQCETPGLGLIPGDIKYICNLTDDQVKVPHIGWNDLDFKQPNSKLLKYINNSDNVYFVHSYCATNCKKYVVASSSYHIDIPAIVQNKNVYGTQFHPEKSGDVGLKILKAFCEV